MKTTSNGGYRRLVAEPGFHAFLWTQFLGAFNDNLCKMVVSLRAVDVAARSGSEYLALAGRFLCCRSCFFPDTPDDSPIR